MQHNFLKRGNY